MEMFIQIPVKQYVPINRPEFIPGKPFASPCGLPVIQGTESVYLESMRKLRQVLNYGNSGNTKK